MSPPPSGKNLLMQFECLQDKLSNVSSEGKVLLSLNPLCQASVEESHNGHLAAIVVPVVLVVLIIATITAWQLRREYLYEFYFLQKPNKIL